MNRLKPSGPRTLYILQCVVEEEHGLKPDTRLPGDGVEGPTLGLSMAQLRRDEHVLESPYGSRVVPHPHGLVCRIRVGQKITGQPPAYSE